MRTNIPIVDQVDDPLPTQMPTEEERRHWASLTMEQRLRLAYELYPDSAVRYFFEPIQGPIEIVRVRRPKLARRA